MCEIVLGLDRFWDFFLSQPCHLGKKSFVFNDELALYVLDVRNKCLTQNWYTVKETYILDWAEQYQNRKTGSDN